MKEPLLVPTSPQNGDNSLLTLPDGVCFEDIDWGTFFQNRFSYGYNAKSDFSAYRNGNSLDVEKLCTETGWNSEYIMRYMNPDQTPNLSLIFQALESGFLRFSELESITVAIPDLSQLTSADQERIQQGLFQQISLSLHEFHDLIAKLELLYPTYIQSFQLIENLFPKILQRPHILKTPANVSGTFDEHYQHFLSEGYDEEEARELAQQMIEYKTSAWMLRTIHREPNFPLKQNAKQRITTEPVGEGAITSPSAISDIPDFTVKLAKSRLQVRALEAISTTHSLEDVLLADGFTPEEIEKEKLELAELKEKVIGNSKSQKEMEDRLFGDPHSRTPHAIAPNEAIEVIPALLALDQFPFDLEQWLTKVMEIDGDWERSKPALRYLELWIDKVTPEKREFILRRCLEAEDTGAYEYFTLYADKVIRLLQDMPDFLSEVWQLIGDTTWNYLNLLSRLPASKVPKEIKDKLAPWTPPESQIQVSTKIRSARHVDKYTGLCGWIEEAHKATIIDPNYKIYEEELYGNVVIIFVDNIPVGSMKMYRSRSIIGLRNIADSDGRLPLVKGGVYTTNKAISAAAEAAFSTQGKWARLDVDDLPLVPRRLIGSENSFNEYAKYMTGLDRTLQTESIFSP